MSKREKFIKLFQSIFRIRDSRGRLKPFKPLPYQQEFLQDSILCNDDYKNRIVCKGRGIGLTATIAGEIVLAAAMMPKIKIPVTSISARTANVLIDWCIDLIDNSRDFDGLRIERDTKNDSIVRLDNGSEIIPISGGSPDSIRSLRSPILVLDEFAFNPYQKEILTAGERCLSEGGQLTIISTPNGMGDEFWRIYQNAEVLGFKRYTFPVFEKLDLDKPIPVQKVEPIAPWLDLGALEEARRRDPIMFARENLCMPQDESVAFLSWDLIQRCCTLQRGEVKAKDVFAGIDVGRYHDYTAVEVFTERDGIFYHVDEILMRNTEIPLQVEYIKNLDYNFENINIDMTGIGLGLYEYLEEELPCKGITFTKKTKMEMAVNLRNLMQDGQVKLLQDRDLMNDLHSIRYDTMDAPRNAQGHADRFWAVALALHEMGVEYIEPYIVGGRIW